VYPVDGVNLIFCQEFGNCLVCHNHEFLDDTMGKKAFSLQDVAKPAFNVKYDIQLW